MKKTRGEAGVAQAERRGTLFAAGLIVGRELGRCGDGDDHCGVCDFRSLRCALGLAFGKLGNHRPIIGLGGFHHRFDHVCTPRGAQINM